MVATAKITYRQINKITKEGFVGCLATGKIKTTPITYCKMSCPRFAGIEGDELKCGAVGSNETLVVRNPTTYDIRQTLISYGEDCRGALV